MNLFPGIRMPSYNTYWAFPLKRAVQKFVENPIAGRILRGEFTDRDTVVMDVKEVDGGREFVFGKK